MTLKWSRFSSYLFLQSITMQDNFEPNHNNTGNDATSHKYFKNKCIFDWDLVPGRFAINFIVMAALINICTINNIMMSVYFWAYFALVTSANDERDWPVNCLFFIAPNGWTKMSSSQMIDDIHWISIKCLLDPKIIYTITGAFRFHYT